MGLCDAEQISDDIDQEKTQSDVGSCRDQGLYYVSGATGRNRKTITGLWKCVSLTEKTSKHNPHLKTHECESL